MAQALLKKESASQEVTHKIQKLRYVPLAFAARSETIAFFSYHQKVGYGFARGATCAKSAIGDEGPIRSSAPNSWSSVSFELMNSALLTAIGSFMILESSWARTIAMARGSRV